MVLSEYSLCMWNNELNEPYYLCRLFPHAQESLYCDVKKMWPFCKVFFQSSFRWKNMVNSLVPIVLMFSHRPGTMWLALLVCQLGLILRTEAQIPEACIISETNRAPGLQHLLWISFFLHTSIAVWSISSPFVISTRKLGHHCALWHWAYGPEHLHLPSLPGTLQRVPDGPQQSAEHTWVFWDSWLDS